MEVLKLIAIQVPAMSLRYSFLYLISARLSEVRIILEKIKPLELKLKYQIEKYLKMMNAEKSDVLDKSNFRAKLENLTVKHEVDSSSEHIRVALVYNHDYYFLGG